MRPSRSRQPTRVLVRKWALTFTALFLSFLLCGVCYLGGILLTASHNPGGKCSVVCRFLIEMPILSIIICSVRPDDSFFFGLGVFLLLSSWLQSPISPFAPAFVVNALAKTLGDKFFFLLSPPLDQDSSLSLPLSPHWHTLML